MGLFFTTKKEKQVKAAVAMLVPQVNRITEESLKIINSTKKVDTGISRFETIKTVTARLFEVIPQGEDPGKYLSDFAINNVKIKSPNDLKILDELKNDWVHKFFAEKIDKELSKASMLSDLKLKNAQLKKALKSALEAAGYLPDDEKLRSRISEIESQITHRS